MLVSSGATAPELLDRIKGMGFAIFTSGDYNANVIGQRTVSRVANAFDDWMHLIWKVNGTWEHHRWQITTDPGLYWLENPMRLEGTAILAPGQYRGAYQIGKHQGRYQAVVQTGGKVAVYRDGNRNGKLDPEGGLEWGYFGINHHRTSSSRTSTRVDKWSAGCQVFADPDDFADYLRMAKVTTSCWGPRLTYTLVGD